MFGIDPLIILMIILLVGLLVIKIIGKMVKVGFYITSVLIIIILILKFLGISL